MKNREIRWGRRYRDFYVDPDSAAFDLLIDDAIDRGYISSGFSGFSTVNTLKIVKLDRLCRDHLNAELIIGESTGRVNGIRFRTVEDCLGFKLRIP